MAESPEVVGFVPTPLVACAYVSTPTTPFTDRDLSDLLLSARRWNARHGITGKLIVLEEDGQLVRFAQWIEGAERDIEACFERIAADPRHTDLEVRRQGPIQGRRFPAWEMAIDAVPAGTFGSESTALVDP